MGTAGCVSWRALHLQVISCSALEKLELRSVDIRNALSQADAFQLEVHLQAPLGLNLMRKQRLWKLKAPAFGFGRAPAAFYKKLHGYLLRGGDCL